MYMICTPRLQSLGWPQLFPSFDDFLQSFGHRPEAQGGNMQKSGKVFDTKAKYPVPKEFKYTTETAGAIFKKAGPLSNRRSAGASAWLLGHAEEPDTDKFHTSLVNAWAGNDLIYSATHTLRY